MTTPTIRDIAKLNGIALGKKYMSINPQAPRHIQTIPNIMTKVNAS
jgi:hypothetical protein